MRVEECLEHSKLSGEIILQTRLFHFTNDEESSMELAKKSSLKYMENFGRGREPYEIDLSHYENSLPEEQCHQKEDTK